MTTSPERAAKADSGPTTESGPLGPVDPAVASAPASAVRPAARAAGVLVVEGLVALIVSLVVLGSIAEGVRDQEVFALDTWATPYLHGIASPALDALMNGLTTMGSSLVIVPVFVLVMAGLLWKHRYGSALFLGVASGGALVLNGTMKLIFQRPRPQLPWAQVLPDYSFPSGHTMNGVVFYLALAVIAWSIFGRRVGLLSVIVAAVLAIGIGVSRIYLGYHYFTDVIGGLLAGVAWLLIVGAAFHARPTWWLWGRASAEKAREADRPDPARAS